MCFSQFNTFRSQDASLIDGTLQFCLDDSTNHYKHSTACATIFSKKLLRATRGMKECIHILFIL